MDYIDNNSGQPVTRAHLRAQWLLEVERNWGSLDYLLAEYPESVEQDFLDEWLALEVEDGAITPAQRTMRNSTAGLRAGDTVTLVRIEFETFYIVRSASGVEHMVMGGDLA